MHGSLHGMHIQQKILIYCLLNFQFLKTLPLPQFWIPTVLALTNFWPALSISDTYSMLISGFQLIEKERECNASKSKGTRHMIVCSVLYELKHAQYFCYPCSWSPGFSLCTGTSYHSSKASNKDCLFYWNSKSWQFLRLECRMESW